MKIIEALKLIKDLKIKADDIVKKIRDNTSFYDYEELPYGEKQRDTVNAFMQAHHDLVKEIGRLKVAIQKTNLLTKVAIPVEPDKPTVEKSIAEWIVRRRDLAQMQQAMWAAVGARPLQEGKSLPNPSDPTKPGREVKVVRFFEQAQKDQRMEIYRAEPGLIDRTLEVVNATTDLIED